MEFNEKVNEKNYITQLPLEIQLKIADYDIDTAEAMFHTFGSEYPFLHKILLKHQNIFKAQYLDGYNYNNSYNYDKFCRLVENDDIKNMKRVIQLNCFPKGWNCINRFNHFYHCKSKSMIQLLFIFYNERDMNPLIFFMTYHEKPVFDSCKTIMSYDEAIQFLIENNMIKMSDDIWLDITNFKFYWFLIHCCSSKIFSLALEKKLVIPEKGWGETFLGDFIKNDLKYLLYYNMNDKHSSEIGQIQYRIERIKHNYHYETLSQNDINFLIKDLIEKSKLVSKYTEPMTSEKIESIIDENFLRRKWGMDEKKKAEKELKEHKKYLSRQNQKRK